MKSLGELVDPAKAFALFLSIPGVSLVIWSIPYYHLTPLAAWGLNEGMDSVVYGIMASLVGVGVGFVHPNKRASQVSFVWAIGQSGALALICPLMYNIYSSRPPNVWNYYPYQFICILCYILTYTALGYCFVNIGKVVSPKREEKQEVKEKENKQKGPARETADPD